MGIHKADVRQGREHAWQGADGDIWTDDLAGIRRTDTRLRKRTRRGHRNLPLECRRRSHQPPVCRHVTSTDLPRLGIERTDRERAHAQMVPPAADRQVCLNAPGTYDASYMHELIDA